MVGVFACLLTGNRPIVYLDVYKTGAARLYSGPERWAIARTCEMVFCRAESLARTLRHIGADARAAGNVMMDTIPEGGYDAASRRSRPLGLTLLPGSRALTAESFALQIQSLRLLPPEVQPDVFLAVAGSVNVDELARAASLSRTPMLSAEPADLGQLSDGKLTVHMARGSALGSLLAASDLVLSQAGTATVQALGMGRPVVTFINARDRRSRFEDEQKLFGDARRVVTAEPESVAAALRQLLTDQGERQRLAAIGQERIGGPGAIEAILEALTS
jgi:uncharacterized protein (TIGR03492 family)